MNSDQFQSRPDSPFQLERLMRLTLRQDPTASFDTEEAFVQAMSDRIDDGLPDGFLQTLQNDPLELAQEFAFQAFECENETEAMQLVDRALQLDPGCVDALTLQAFLDSSDAGELLSRLNKIVEGGKRRLGEDFFADFDGSFWRMIPARPYLRSLKQEAEVMWTVGRRFAAVARYRDLLTLDPLNHLGNGQLLIGYYLAMGEVQHSWDLLEEVDDGRGAVFAWAWVLLHLLTGDEEEAREVLDRALSDNPFAAPLLIGLGGEDPGEVGALVLPGSEDEARVCAQILGEGWERSGPAQWWLYQVLVDLGMVVVEEDSDPDLPG